MELRAAHRRHAICCRGSRCRRSCCTRATTRPCRRRRRACSPPRIPGATLRRARLAQPHPARSRAGLGAVQARRCSRSRAGRASAAAERSDLRSAIGARARDPGAASRRAAPTSRSAAQLFISEKTVRNHVTRDLREARRAFARAGDRAREGQAPRQRALRRGAQRVIKPRANYGSQLCVPVLP